MLFKGLLTLNICGEESNQALSVITTVDPNAPIGGVFITVAKEKEVGSYLSKNSDEKSEVNHPNILFWKSFISLGTELEIQRKRNDNMMKFAD